MPANTDPAETGIDLADVLAMFQQVPKAVAVEVANVVQPLKSPPFFDARSIGIGVGEPVMILPFHAGRVRFYAKAPATDDVIMIGSLAQLQNDSGYVLGTTAEVAFSTVAPIYAKCLSSTAGFGTLSLWAEYSVE